MPQNTIPSADTPESVYDVFLSYSHADAELYGKELVESIKEEIQKEIEEVSCRRLVFLDTEALKYGDEWHAKIMEKLQECRVFICLLSENYLKSSYCTRERLWWEMTEIRRGRLRQDTLPVYFIRLDRDPFKDDRLLVRDLSGFQLEPEPWFPKGREVVKGLYVKDRIDNLKYAVKDRLSRARIAATGFNNVFPGPSSSFAGRVLELKALREICACNRYPVIEGGAGVGKSELATVYAYGYASEYPQGCFFLHMEGKRLWEDAVLSIIQDPETDPKTGTNAKMELGITDEEIRQNGQDGSRESLHRLIVERLFARARNGRLLLVLDNVDDASLFNERKLLDFSQKRPIPDNIHMIATTRHEFVFPERSRAKAFHLDNLDDDASFELFCEIGENRFPFCKRPVLDKTGDPEYSAAMEIIHLLEGHAWSMEIVAGQIADQYDEGVTFRGRLASLRESFSIEDDGEEHYSYRNHVKSPANLVRSTLNILKDKENGDAIVRLACFAALLPPDGEKKDVLRVCWNKFFSALSFKSKDGDAFLHAFNHLWRYNLLHGKDNDKMHRLTQTALKQIMKEDGSFGDCLEKTADVMAGTLSIPNRIRVDAFAATPELAECLDGKHPAFLSTSISPDEWTQLLSGNPSSAALVRLCPWDKLNGLDWGKLLGRHPQFADRCPWEKLNGTAWSILLRRQPRFADRCPWEKLDGRDWADLLSEQPVFADKCAWDKLNGEEWGDLLGEQPGFADRCAWGRLSGKDWAWLLSEQPDFSGKCPWDELDGDAWAGILRKQPGFADQCPWEKLDGFDWACLLSEQPGFAGECAWEKLDGSDWCELLCRRPEFADRCPWEKMNAIEDAPWKKIMGFKNLWMLKFWETPEYRTRNYWVLLLCKQSRFADRCPWEKLDGEAWSDLLCFQPQFADRCPWEKLDGEAWSDLLCFQPQFADRCAWDKLNGKNWAWLLHEQPEFADQCPWENLDGSAWSRILCGQPQFAARCPWEKLDGEAWADLLCGQSQFADQCPWEKLSGKNWAELLFWQPQFADRCPWDELDGEAWADLLGKSPEFIGKCPDDVLSGKNWAVFLSRQPQFADRCPWEELDGEAWVYLLSRQPQFADWCPWEKLDGKSWANLLRKEPRFAGKCPWEKLDGFDWTCLLKDQPRFADRCPWEKLKGNNWGWLLQEQPQFADKCPWEKLSGLDWAGVLVECPGLSGRCPWEKLSGFDWSLLLSWQPQFADQCPWEKLDGFGWSLLLSRQPQFADKCPRNGPDAET